MCLLKLIQLLTKRDDQFTYKYHIIFILIMFYGFCLTGQTRKIKIISIIGNGSYSFRGSPKYFLRHNNHLNQFIQNLYYCWSNIGQFVIILFFFQKRLKVLGKKCLSSARPVTEPALLPPLVVMHDYFDTYIWRKVKCAVCVIGIHTTDLV